jgi:CheY-like chemotaxis protein
MKTILIVDNDIAVRTMMKLVLEGEGFATLEAENGSVAFSLAMERKPDLVISDVMMENLNGFMLYELLHRERSTRDIPLILITGEAADFGAWNAEKKVAYFQKPLSMHDLVKEVKNRLGETPSDDKEVNDGK